MMADALREARDLILRHTPLLRDCGELCDTQCCRDADDEVLGMLLFSGEERLYTTEDDAWMSIMPSDISRLGHPVNLLLCEGRCPRERRPLACRIFPIAPKVRNGRVEVRIDARAWHLCPLANSGIGGLDPKFVRAVQEAFDLLWQDSSQRAYLSWLSQLVDNHMKLLRMFKVKE